MLTRAYDELRYLNGALSQIRWLSLFKNFQSYVCEKHIIIIYSLTFGCLKGFDYMSDYANSGFILAILDFDRIYYLMCL